MAKQYVEDMNIRLHRFESGKGTETLWSKEYAMPGSYGVWYLDITLEAAWRYPPFPRGALASLGFGRGEEEMEKL